LLEKALFCIAEEISAIFHVGKRNIQNWKMIDNWGNTNIALPLSFRRTSFQSISSLPRQLPFPNTATNPMQCNF
jgi:3-deoxy-D-arabino-heptulosonate 7-phosphate (DAHP) synthase